MSVPTASASLAEPGEEQSRGPFERLVAWLCVLGGVTGLAGSFGLTLEKLAKLADPGHEASCDFNPIISCGSVMDSPQGSTFGFPNPLVGLAAYGALIAIGVVLLAGFQAPRWFWIGLQVGTGLGVVFVHWLIFASLYWIWALCPYCMIVWVATIVVFWYVTIHNLERGYIGGGGSIANGLVRFHSLGLTLWFLVLVGLSLQAFWSFWTTLV